MFITCHTSIYVYVCTSVTFILEVLFKLELYVFWGVIINMYCMTIIYTCTTLQGFVLIFVLLDK